MKVKVVLEHDGVSYVGEATLVAQSHGQRVGAKPASLPVATKPTTPADIVDTLYKKGFFQVARSHAETREEFSKLGCNYGDSSIAMSLTRAEYLKKDGLKRPYKFVQKYPPAM